MSETRAITEARAVGVVTGHTSRSTHHVDDPPGRVFFPSVRFRTADSRTVEFENKLGTNAPPRVGERVTVLYDPERPEEAKVAFGSIVRRNVMAFVVMGAIILGVMFSSFMLFVGVFVWIAVS